MVSVAWLVLAFAVFVFLYPRIFEDNNTRKKMAGWLTKEESFGERYRSLLGGGLDWLERKIDGRPQPSEGSSLKDQRKYYFRLNVFSSLTVKQNGAVALPSNKGTQYFPWKIIAASCRV